MWSVECGYVDLLMVEHSSSSPTQSRVPFQHLFSAEYRMLYCQLDTSHNHDPRYRDAGDFNVQRLEIPVPDNRCIVDRRIF